jgi:predicted phosphodiesterase
VIEHTVEKGHIFIASDCHYWPEESTTAHKAFVSLLNEFKPKTIVLNGDVFDGARVSRHAALMGTNPPTPKQEIEACQDRLDEIAKASKNAVKLWTYGNHDVRLFNYIAQNAPELSEFSDLFAYFPGWHTGWRIDVNGSVIIKHRYHNGIHSTWNNALKSGRSIVTGHLHQLKITPFSDYDGRRWGVDAGTLAEPYSDQFTYTEMNPVNWCSGFAVLTFENGKLLPPELCEVINGVAYFRGQRV